MTTTQAFYLKRNNHPSDMIEDFEKMFKDENMVDVSLFCEDEIIKAHKIILSACSSYFREILSKVNNPYQYPIIIIKDMSYADLKAIIDFIYRGEVTVPQEQLNSVLKSAEALKVKGLSDVNSQKSQLSENKHCNENDNQTNNQSRKRKKKRRKSNNINNQNNEDLAKKCAIQNTLNKHDINSSDDASDFSEDDTQNHENSQHQQINHGHLAHSQSSQHHNNSALSAMTTEGEIEPSRLLEQTMITGDAQNISNIQSINPSINQNKYPQYLISSVKQMMYDDSSGLIASHLGSNEQNSLASNHNIALAHFEESSSLNSLAGPSGSISQLMTRQNEGSSGLSSGGASSSHHSQQQLQSSSLHGNNSVQSTHLLHLNSSQQNLQPNEDLAPNTEGSGNLRGCYQCTYCLKRFDVRYSLARHIRVIHDPTRRLFSCNSCGRRFAWKSAFLRHVNVTCINRNGQRKSS